MYMMSGVAPGGGVETRRDQLVHSPIPGQVMAGWEWAGTCPAGEVNETVRLRGGVVSGPGPFALFEFARER